MRRSRKPPNLVKISVLFEQTWCKRKPLFLAEKQHVQLFETLFGLTLRVFASKANSRLFRDTISFTGQKKPLLLGFGHVPGVVHMMLRMLVSGPVEGGATTVISYISDEGSQVACTCTVPVGGIG